MNISGAMVVDCVVGGERQIRRLLTETNRTDTERKCGHTLAGWVYQASETEMKKRRRRFANRALVSPAEEIVVRLLGFRILSFTFVV
jgi:hypothetical protein